MSSSKPHMFWRFWQCLHGFDAPRKIACHFVHGIREARLISSMRKQCSKCNREKIPLDQAISHIFQTALEMFHKKLCQTFLSKGVTFIRFFVTYWYCAYSRYRYRLYPGSSLLFAPQLASFLISFRQIVCLTNGRPKSAIFDCRSALSLDTSHCLVLMRFAPSFLPPMNTMTVSL